MAQLWTKACGIMKATREFVALPQSKRPVGREVVEVFDPVIVDHRLMRTERKKAKHQTNRLVN